MAFSRCDGDKIIHTCDACRIEFRMGRAIYEGKSIPELNMTVCRSCGPDSWSITDRANAIKRLASRKVINGNK